MTKRLLAPTLLFLLLCGLMSTAAAEEPSFAKLDSKQIRVRFPGKELTDEMHFAYRFDPNGRIAIASVVGKDRQGKWRIVKDTLCLLLDLPTAQGAENCYEVWMAGKSVELRTGDDPSMSSITGRLLKPETRQ